MARNPFTVDHLADPYPILAGLRTDAPVQPVVHPNGLTTWLVTRYADARAALTDRRLAKDPRHARDALVAAGVLLGDGDMAAAPTLLTSDPPDHTRLRRLVSGAFTPRRVAGMRSRIQRITDELLDALAGRAEFDLIAEFAFPLPATVAAELIGVPADDRFTFRRWVAEMLTPAGEPDSRRVREAASKAMRDYLTAFVAERRRAAGRTPAGDGPGAPSAPDGHGAPSAPDGRGALDAPDGPDAQPDLAGALIAVRDEGERLTEAELIRMLEELLIGGYETTANLIGNGGYALLTHPDQIRLLVERPELIPSAVEEFLRFEGPVMRATLRVAVEPVPIGGVTIPAGSLVSIVLGSANRDEARFTAAAAVDVARTDNPHLAFGHGAHYCLGAPLARVEGEIAFGALLARFPGMSLACPAEEVRYRPIGIQRGLAALPVRTGEVP